MPPTIKQNSGEEIKMKFHLTFGLADRPGQLLNALEPIAKNGGNIISIVHDREKVTSGYVPVSLVVDFSTRENFEKAKKESESLGFIIMKSEELTEKSNITFLLIGKVDIRRILETEAEGMRITDFEVSAPTSKEACVKLNIEAHVKAVDKILETFKEIANKEDAILVSSV